VRFGSLAAVPDLLYNPSGSPGYTDIKLVGFAPPPGLLRLGWAGESLFPDVIG
jgi:hypothetical protein